MLDELTLNLVQVAHEVLFYISTVCHMFESSNTLTSESVLIYEQLINVCGMHTWKENQIKYFQINLLIY